MDPTKNKLDNFTNTFLAEASRRANDIIKGVEASRDQIRKETEAALEIEVSEYTKKRLAEINNREGSRVSAQLLENKRKLLAFREKCAHEVMEDVKKRIDDFVHSDKYPEHLADLFDQAQNALNSTAPIIVYLRKEDMKYSDIIKQMSKSEEISFEVGNFTLGGIAILCPSKNMGVDQSFDTALESMRDNFAELSGIDFE